MKILFIGDIVGRSGRDALAKHLPDIRSKLEPDAVIVNAENAAHGFGITDKICKELYELGVDIISTGNHVWDQKDIMLYIDRDPKLLRPANFPKGTPGRGVCEHTLFGGEKIVTVNLMGRLFMDALDDPFAAMEEILQKYSLGRNADAIFVDFHAETTSEKTAFAHYVDGRVSAVVGTHTHVPTADGRILPGGTAFQSDAGMTGDYNSVIGMDIKVPIHRFTRKTPTERLSPANGEGTVCGILVKTQDQGGKANSIEPVIVGPHLKNTH